jgi:hypothetical protein
MTSLATAASSKKGTKNLTCVGLRTYEYILAQDLSWPHFLQASFSVRLCKSVTLPPLQNTTTTFHTMSSLKNIIMDVDVEPLESFASRRPREAAQLPGEPSQNPPASQSPKLDVSEQSQSDIRRRRSNRVSKPSSQTSSSRPNLARRRSSGTAESMEPYGHQPGSSQSSSSMGMPRQSSRGSNPPEPHIRYTPVTGRVSRAKKGQPVHVCDQCDPPRVWFPPNSLQVYDAFLSNDPADLYASRTSKVCDSI